MSIETSRRAVWCAALVGIAMLTVACSGDDDASPPETASASSVVDTGGSDTAPDALPAVGGPGLIDESVWQRRVDDYLAFATREKVPAGQPVSANLVLAHSLRAERDDGFGWDPAEVTEETFADSFAKLDEWRDTGDFDLMYLINLLYVAGDDLSPEVVDAIEERMLGFRYWYDDPLPDDRLDHKWFWSENHRIIFAVIEYLAGQRLADEVFEVTGLTGVEHQARARDRIVDWVAERATFGFSEWHSNVYMQKNVVPLATLVQWADDPELVRLGAAGLDLALLDVGSHIQEGGYGATHGRSYQKDSYSALAEDTWGLAKLLFDDTELPYQSPSDAGAVTLAMLDRYRVPEAIVRIADTTETTVDLERHGVALDPQEPLSDDPPHPDGHPFDDVPFWWSQGALTAWQVVPSVFETAEEFRLWETDLFQPFVLVRDITGGDVETAQALALQLAPFASFGLMGEVDTYTWRSPHGMLSSAIDYRPGHRRDQAHAWQATLDAGAQVFTTHPGNPPREGDSFEDGDQYWTGSASMPRSVQHENVAIHAYDPAYDAPGPPLDDLFGALDETHAWFPTEHFDEVTRTEILGGGTWTFGRKGDGYVALWSMRPTEWRSHDPAVTPTGGLTEDFDLVAPGGADNVWIVEMGSSADGTFEEWTRVVGAAPITVDDLGGGLGAGFAVTYESPSVGLFEVAADGTASVAGEAVEVGGHERLDAPWGTWDGDGPLRVEWEGATLSVDLVTGERTVG